VQARHLPRGEVPEAHAHARTHTPGSVSYVGLRAGEGG
jgi:hypothetical protein